jgi:hypothetical protein
MATQEKTEAWLRETRSNELFAKPGENAYLFRLLCA